MLVYVKALALAGLFVAITACGSSRHSPAGFRLPADGDPERGKVAFVQFECHTCHEVSGADLERRASEQAFLVSLGGTVGREIPDGHLVSSIIYPSHKIAIYPRQHLITASGESRMPDYNERMTVRQLTDLVAFLRSHYTVTPPSRYVYH